MKKRILTAAIVAVLLASCLSGCGENKESKPESSASQNESSASQNESSASQNESSASQNESSTSQNESSASQTESSTSQPESSASQDESSASQNESSASQNESSASQNESSASQNESSTSQTENSSVPESTTVSEADFTIGFHVEMGGTMITSYKGSATVVEFPTMIDGKKIQMISNKGSVDNYKPECAYPSIKVAIIPNSVSDIDGYAFYNCKNLTSVTFGQNIYWVSKEAFSGCTNLTDVAINDSIYHIDSDAFKGCTKLKNVTYKGKTYTYANIDALIKAING